MKKYALPAAAIAAVIAVSGTSGAVASSLITGAQIKDGTVTGADIKNGSLAAADLNAAAQAKLKGLHSITVAQSQVTAATADTKTMLSQDCPAGTLLISATAYWEQSSRAIQIFYSTNDSSPATQAQAYSDGSEVDGDVLHLQDVCGKFS